MAEKQTASHDREPAGGIDPSSFAGPRGTPEQSSAPALHVCPECESALVYPVDWAPVGHQGWSVELRCPDCEWNGGGIYTQAVVDRFDEALDTGTEQLLDDLTLLARANVEERIERFAAALQADEILPEDF